MSDLQNITKEIEKNRELILSEIGKTCANVDRDPEEITLVAVSKKFPEERIKIANEIGQTHFGENLAQELKRKAQCIDNVSWHFIGKLQSNKINYILPHTLLLHTLDRMKLAKAIQKKCEASKRTLNVLIQVNISEENQKNGISPSELNSFAKEVKKLSHLEIKGLMAMPAQTDDPEKTRPSYGKMKSLLEELNAEVFKHNPLKELSMGMSDDFKIAIEEGSTMVRIGSALFGKRPN
jgi:hypothetical protein